MQALLGERKQDHASCLRDLDAGRNVFGEKQLFNRNLVRMKRIDQRADILINLTQTQMHRHAGLCCCRAVLHGRELEVFKPHDPIADRTVARVDTKNRHSCKPLPSQPKYCTTKPLFAQPYP